MSDELAEALWRTFFPFANEMVEDRRRRGMKFVHYTSADSAMKILSSGSMYLRNSNLMNDFSEVNHGLMCLQTAYRGSHGGRLKEIIQKLDVDLPDALEENFATIFNDFCNHTYLISVSEHGDPNGKDTHEENFGRLSMWRAYAEKNGVAIIFNNTAILSETNALNAYSSPVTYETCDEFSEGSFKRLVDSIEQNVELLSSVGPVVVHNLLIDAFRFAVQSTKHPAFREEREWRIIYTPKLLERSGELTTEQMNRVPTEIVTIGGVPQRVYKILFKNYPEEDFVGVSIPEIVHRILIGPAPDAYHIREAFAQCLAEHEVQDADARVVITNIPLRC